MDLELYPLIPPDPRASMRLMDFFNLVTKHGPYTITDPINTWLYFLNFGKFQKIGITKRTIEDRFKRYKKYYTIVDKLKLAEKDARYLERRFLGLVDGPYKFNNPNHEMKVLGGFTECFYHDRACSFKDLIPESPVLAHSKTLRKPRKKTPDLSILKDIYDD